MKSKLLALLLLAGSSAAFAETRFSINIGGGYGPGYYAPPPVYYAPVRPHRFYGPRAGSYGYQTRGYGQRYIYRNGGGQRDRQFRGAYQQDQYRNQGYDGRGYPGYGNRR